MHVVGKKFGKICLKAIRDTFFPICGLWSGTRGLIFLVGVYPTEGGSSNFLACSGSPPPQSCSLVGHPDLPIRKILRRVLGLLTVMNLESVRENTFFQSNKFTTCKIEDSGSGKFFDGVQSTEDYPFISR